MLRPYGFWARPIIRRAKTPKKNRPGGPGRLSVLGSPLAPILDGDVRQVHGPGVPGKGAEQFWGGVVLQALQDPTRDPSQGKHREKDVLRNVQEVVDGAREEVDVHKDATVLVAFHALLDELEHLVPLG